MMVNSMIVRRDIFDFATIILQSLIDHDTINYESQDTNMLEVRERLEKRSMNLSILINGIIVL